MSKTKKIVDDEQFTITLKKPVQWGSDVVEELIFTEPLAKHIKFGANPDTSDIFKIAKRCLHTPDSPSIIDELRARDGMQVANLISTFLDAGQTTGNMD